MSSEMNLIAARYVEALFELADEGKQHDAVKRDMLVLKTLLSQSTELCTLLESPVITRAQAENAISAVLAATKADALTKKFFVLLAHQRRLSLTPVIIEKYLARLAESQGELAVHLTSASELSKEQLAVLSKALTKATGKKVDIKSSENPALLGGVQIRVGSLMLDNSIAGKLARLRQNLTKAA